MVAVASVPDLTAIATAVFVKAADLAVAETDLVVLVASFDKAVVPMAGVNLATAADRPVAEVVAG